MRLIDADALKIKVENLVAGGAERLKDYYENGAVNEEGEWIGGVYDVWELINNAPTVEQPTSEWVHREDMDFIDENHVLHQHFMCRKCGYIHDFIDGHTSQYNFCPQCGLKMKGGEENEIDN